MLTDLLKSLGLLGAFLLIGTLLRAKLKPLQQAFIPASVIGGSLLLILGPQALNVLPVPEEWFSYYSIIPGILIVPVVAAVPLGLRLNRGSGAAPSDFMKNIPALMGLSVGVSFLQIAAGYGINALFSGAYDLYDVFGIELAVGYVGGHGTAGTLGNTLMELNLPYWETSQGVGTTTATFGIVGGILIGILLINWAARHGQTALLQKPADLPLPMRVGFEKDPAKQNSCGRETTVSSSIDTVAFHAAIIFAACGLAYLALKYAKAFNIPVLSSVTVWTYGMLIMFAIWGLLCRLKLDYLVDSKVKSHITGPFTEFAVIGAVASLPIKAVAVYIVPILVLVTVGYILTTAFLFFLGKRYLKGCWFEQMIGFFGASTGVFVTGVLLLRICDPDGETPALSNYSLAYALSGVIFYAMLNMFIVMPISTGALTAALISLGVTLVCVLFIAVSSRLSFGKEFKGN